VTFDREPDLDNANVGMPNTRILGRTKFMKEVTKSVASFFVVFGGVFMVKINGVELNLAGKTVAEYLANTNYDPKRIAVERNGDIVPKAQYGQTVLKEGDSVEVVSFVGGG
jgi:sulfur carrier protein